MDRDELYKEIDLIQGCINRMSHNSFVVKGWALSIIAVITAILREQLLQDTALIICCAIVPFVCFWILDAFYLHTEKKYRKLYEWVLQARKNNNDDYKYDLNPNRFRKEVGCCICTFFSKTLLLFYGLPLTAVIVLMIII